MVPHIIFQKKKKSKRVIFDHFVVVLEVHGTMHHYLGLIF